MKAIICTIIAGCFALACCFTISLSRRWYCISESRVFDNWTGTAYYFGGSSGVRVIFSKDMANIATSAH